MNKMNQIRIFCSIILPHILCLTETWTRPDVDDIEIGITGYSMYRKDRADQRGGGIIVYVSERLNYKTTIEDMNIDFEHLLLKVKHSISREFYLMTMYIPPNRVNDFKSKFRQDFESLSKEELIITGDVNIDWHSSDHNSWKRNIRNLGFKQLIEDRTRITSNSSTLLDHIYVTKDLNISGSGVIPIRLSDHFMTYVGRKVNYNTKADKKRKEITFRVWRDLDETVINNKLQVISMNSLNVDKNVNDLTEEIHKIIETEIPLKKKTIKYSKTEEWVDCEVLSAINRKNRIEKQIEMNRKLANDNTILTEVHKQIRNETNAIISRKKKNFFFNKIIECGKNTTKIWKMLNLLVKTKAEKTKSKIESDKLSAEDFNNHFITEPQRIIDEEYEANYQEINLIEESEEKYPVPHINEEQLIAIINNCQTNKASGTDSIPMKFVKIFKFSLVIHLVNIINKSIDTSKFPAIWKIAKVIPVFKSGKHDDINNYRPISLLSILSKFFEKHIESTLREFLTTNRLLSNQQFGFKAKHSTIDALISIKHFLLNAMNNNQKAVLFTFDLKKAFDCVNHNILIQKLKKYCDQTTVKLLENYLMNRSSFVKYNNKISTFQKIITSVPQGGCLAPLLFIIYMDDITKLKLKGKLVLFADDMSYMLSAKNYQQINQDIRHDMTEISKWLRQNRLVLNYKKTNFMIMGTPKEASTQEIKPSINGKEIPKVNYTKILGVYFDHSLKFDKHLEELSKDLNKKVGVFHRLSLTLPESTLQFIFNSVVKPKIEYGCVLWGYTYATHIHPIKILQKKFARIITHSRYYEHAEPLLERLNIASIEKTVKYHSLNYIYKVINNMASEESRVIFPVNQQRTSRRSGIGRDDKFINTTIAKKRMTQNSLFHEGIKHWNNLPIEVRSKNTLKGFQEVLLLHI